MLEAFRNTWRSIHLWKITITAGYTVRGGVGVVTMVAVIQTATFIVSGTILGIIRIVRGDSGSQSSISGLSLQTEFSILIRKPKVTACSLGGENKVRSSRVVSRHLGIVIVAVA